ncbi:hypothetical protein CKO44_05670 [Rubrivivax gelatinosus]|uniref:DUF2917 family protein n=1 Tax=Rubrivivax gelatinosus TaxID=28068 RepID=A0ABS1DS27_RUBGE|nr:DUF2917 domain-containing protein [Rubrivivax gelatinosus]MBK1612959.1 hypothetical protein [Rubrivivax gelatinosus]MBK1712807.1 hypothetical protein [Rubrivivax gelatinosus]
MSQAVMTDPHQRAPWEWAVEPATAVRLPAANQPRWLAVSEGRVWLTRSGAGPHAQDVWLQTGERHELPAGTEWVLEGWPAAQVELLEAPQPAPARRQSRSGRWHAPWGAAHAA